MKIARTAALTALASLATVGAAGSAFAADPGVQVTGYDSEIYTDESTTVSYQSCGWGPQGVADFILFFDSYNTVYLGSGPTNGSFTFSYPTAGTYTLVVNCFIGEAGDVYDSNSVIYITVRDRPVEEPVEEPATEAPATESTTAPVTPVTPVAPAAAPVATVPAATTPVAAAPAAPAAAAAASPTTATVKSSPTAPALPSTGSNSTTILAAVAAATLAVGESLRRVVRRSARAEG